MEIAREISTTLQEPIFLWPLMVHSPLMHKTASTRPPLETLLVLCLEECQHLQLHHMPLTPTGNRTPPPPPARQLAVVGSGNKENKAPKKHHQKSLMRKPLPLLSPMLHKSMERDFCRRLITGRSSSRLGTSGRWLTLRNRSKAREVDAEASIEMENETVAHTEKKVCLDHYHQW